YHELVHFVGLDDYLTRNSIDLGWVPSELNLSEAYTELISILLYSIYQSIFLTALTNKDFNRICQTIINLESSYSVYLSCSILKFFGYNDKSFLNFFHKTKPFLPPTRIPVM